MTSTGKRLPWSSQQLEALDAIGCWLDHGKQPFFFLAGYAGTGKSTIASEVGRRNDKVIFAAFTGKASAVMREKGCADARTIDSLIYRTEIEVSCGNCQNPPCGRRQRKRSFP
jgi:exodeoxyribonuclease-5